MKLVLSLLLMVSVSPALASSLTGIDLLIRQHKTIDLRLAKKGTVLVFLSAKCPCSISHEESLNALQKEYQAQGFNFVGVHSNADEGDTALLDHFAEAGLKFPVLQDEKSTIADKYGAIKTPHVYVVSPNDKILFQGGVDDSHDAHLSKRHFLKDALVAINEGKSPALKEARTLGCVIAR